MRRLPDAPLKFLLVIQRHLRLEPFPSVHGLQKPARTVPDNRAPMVIEAVVNACRLCGRDKRKNKVVKAVHELVTQGKMPAKSVAIAIGKPYSTLLRETNPLDPGAKLGVETFMAIIETTGDSTPLNVMVRELGYRLAPVD